MPLAALPVLTGFAGRVRATRRQRGLTRQQLADVLSIATQTVGNWERGDTQPRCAVLLALADALGVTLDTLLGDEMPVAPGT